MKVNKEELKDGKVLNKLIDRFITSKNINDLEALFLCLIDSNISVPIDPNMRKKDIEILNKLKEDDYVNQKAIEIRPDWLKGEGDTKVLLPIFSTEEEAPKEYKESFLWIPLTLDDCINMVDANNNCNGLVLNAFTNPIEIKNEYLNALKTMLKETRELERVIEQEKEEGIEYPDIDEV